MAHQDAKGGRVVQLSLLEPAVQSGPQWAMEGARCASCDEGRMYMVAPSDPCTCVEAICICLAEGYALCDCCGEIQQVWPRDMVAAWTPNQPQDEPQR